MEKILKKYTTIPEHLYVNRNADFQLKRIIEDMQRPGYVLVARQMGKTNLLFNAKRTLENDNRLFAYVDLSNLYDDERDCYRNVINNIVEPNSKIFEVVESEIEKIREKNLPPHNEYSRSLRIILNHFKGDLVIILDEIDALKSVVYSDNIFAQIRSNYFSRTSYPIFERLTYVLSGVIEPTELIRDRNKSPFNIGDKIYLDDFSKDEHNNFIEKSGLQITYDISDEIFNWTNGNPRLTFDICSELENLIIQGENVSIKTIEQIIKKKYLTTYDVAPIDHIREIVKTNNQIRNSIKAILKNNSNSLSDDVKRKLYLYGIINSRFDEKTFIKNRILEKSLTEEWIRSIEKDKEISLVTGLVKYESKEFDEAIEIFENLILDPTITKSDLESATYFIGLSYFRQNEFDKAIIYFERNFSNESYADDAVSFVGISKIAIGLKEEGIALLEKSVQKETFSYAYNNALLNLAINIEDREKGLRLFEKLYESTYKTDSENEEELNKLRAMSLYYQTEIYLKSDNVEFALKVIEKSFSDTNNYDVPYFIYLKGLLSKNDDFKDELVNYIVENNLEFNVDETNVATFTAEWLYTYLDLLYENGRKDLFEILLNYSTKKLFISTTRNEIIYRVAQVSPTQRENLLNDILNSDVEIDDDLLFKTYKTLALATVRDSINFIENFNKYSSLFEKRNFITRDDIYIFAFAIKYFSDKLRIDKGIELCKVIEQKVLNNTDPYIKAESTIIYYWLSNLYFTSKNKLEAIKYSTIALNLIEDPERPQTSMIDEKGLQTIKIQLNQIVNSLSIVQPIQNTKKYGRNDKVKVRYLDGKIVEKKYKLLEADILAERCKII